jgi:hyperosmotically inducible protein
METLIIAWLGHSVKNSRGASYPSSENAFVLREGQMNLLKRTSALLLITLLLGAAGCSKSSDDALITTRVKAAISKEPGLNGTKVSVSTDENVVHLSGTVKSRAERAMLIAAARKVDGVKAVKTDLVVQAPQQRTAVKAQAKRQPRAERRTVQPQRAPQPSVYGN